MRTNKSNRAVIVGIFIFVGLAIFVAGVLILGGQQKTFVKSISVTALFDDVSGIQTGNNVLFSGVKVGTVKKIELAPNSQVRIDINIQREAQQFIRNDAMARISTDGLIGNKIIVIYGGGKGSTIKEGDMLAVERALSTDDMMKTLQENNQNLLSITSDFKALSGKVAAGEGTVGKLLTDDQLINQLQATMLTLQRASANTEKLSNNLANFTAKLDDEGTLVNDLVTDTSIFASLRATTRELQTVALTATEFTNNLKTASESFNNSVTNKNSPVGLMLHDEEFARNLKQTMSNLQSGTEKLDENMEALQSNFLLRGFFRKKAKREE